MPSFSQRHIVLASYIIMAGGLLLVFPLRLLPSLLAGLLVFELVNMLTPQLQRLIAGRRARWLAVALLGTLIVSVLALIFAGAISFLLHEAENPGASLNKFMVVVDRARGQLPPFLDSYLPASAAEFRIAIGEWMNKHLSDLQLVGKDAAHMFVTLLIGMVLGAIIALQRIPDISRRSRCRPRCSNVCTCWCRLFAISCLRKSRSPCSTPRLPRYSWPWSCRCWGCICR